MHGRVCTRPPQNKSTMQYCDDLLEDKYSITITLLPSLKTPVEKSLKSGVVYKFKCAACPAAYVGQTARHLLTRFKEHRKEPSPVAKHNKECGSTCAWEDITILDHTANDYSNLLTREALWIEEIKPSLNTQEDFRNRTLTIKLF